MPSFSHRRQCREPVGIADNVESPSAPPLATAILCQTRFRWRQVRSILGVTGISWRRGKVPTTVRWSVSMAPARSAAKQNDDCNRSSMTAFAIVWRGRSVPSRSWLLRIRTLAPKCFSIGAPIDAKPAAVTLSGHT